MHTTEHTFNGCEVIIQKYALSEAEHPKSFIYEV